MNDVLLFHRGGHLDTGLQATARAMAEQLQNWDPDDLLKTPVDDVIDRLVDKGSVRCPRLLTDQSWMPEPTEVVQEFMDFGERLKRRVTRLVLVVPFEGEKIVFTLRAQGPGVLRNCPV